MDGCPSIHNTTVPTTNFTFGQANAHQLGNVTQSTYLRPDVGVALMPWIYTLGIIIVHLPMVFIRVTRWEIVQVWSIVFTTFTVALYIQAYVSTQFDPAQILLWNPLMLVIDAGSMAQVFFLVLEARQTRVGHRVVLSDTVGPESSALRVRLRAWWRQRYPRRQEASRGELLQLKPQQGTNEKAENGPIAPAAGSHEDHRPSVSEADEKDITETLSWYRDPAILSASAAAILFLAVIALQLIGLAQAFRAHRFLQSPPLVSWCSPIFQPFGIAAVDSNCNVWAVEQSSTRGIGCIMIPGIWQQQWLTGTVAVTIIELVLEVADVLLLALVSTKTKVRGAVKLKRPWTTIFSGLAVLGVTLIFGIIYANSIPQNMGKRVTVAMDAQGPASYEGVLTTAGLRGALIGWNDGLLGSWKQSYFGNPSY